MIYSGFSPKTPLAISLWKSQLLKISTVLVTFAGASPAVAQADGDPPTMDLRAVEIVTSATEYLATQEILSVDWFVSFDVVADGREKITYMRSGSNLLQRGVGFYGNSEFGEDTREYFFDGTQFQIYDVEENAYVSTEFVGDFDALADRASEAYDLRLPIWQVMSASPNAELLDRATSAAYLGTTRIAGRQAHHLAFSDYDADWQIWISTEAAKPELMMIVGTDPYTQGWPQYRAYFTNWDFDPDFPDSVFTYVPDDEAEQMAWPQPADVNILGAGN
ncbi:DUF2092 domain-containing protein [Parasedimentitalea maritima]|uniref:DUF2092 domain-containing protein n=1 Tax=Parasedimentitalea maritima TaxID=2578117 RepID=A0A6A4RFG6_9RHOB|nr:DUF2092 domain-containing protein [Zongyanglinia marina]